MRLLLAATALILAFGVVVPTQAEAKAPDARRAWGCFFSAAKPGIGVFDSGDIRLPEEFAGFFRLGGCDRERHFLVVTHLIEVIDGVRVPVRRSEHDVTVGPKHQGRRSKRLPRWHVGSEPGGNRSEWIDGARVSFYCDADVSLQEQGTFLFRMTIKRKHHPGRIYLRSKPVTWPCKNAPFIDIGDGYRLS